MFTKQQLSARTRVLSQFTHTHRILRNMTVTPCPTKTQVLSTCAAARRTLERLEAMLNGTYERPTRVEPQAKQLEATKPVVPQEPTAAKGGIPAECNGCRDECEGCLEDCTACEFSAGSSRGVCEAGVGPAVGWFSRSWMQEVFDHKFPKKWGVMYPIEAKTVAGKDEKLVRLTLVLRQEKLKAANKAARRLREVLSIGFRSLSLPYDLVSSTTVIHPGNVHEITLVLDVPHQSFCAATNSVLED